VGSPKRWLRRISCTFAPAAKAPHSRRSNVTDPNPAKCTPTGPVGIVDMTPNWFPRWIHARGEPLQQSDGRLPAGMAMARTYCGRRIRFGLATVECRKVLLTSGAQPRSGLFTTSTCTFQLLERQLSPSVEAEPIAKWPSNWKIGGPPLRKRWKQISRVRKRFQAATGDPPSRPILIWRVLASTAVGLRTLQQPETGIFIYGRGMAVLMAAMESELSPNQRKRWGGEPANNYQRLPCQQRVLEGEFGKLGGSTLCGERYSIATPGYMMRRGTNPCPPASTSKRSRDQTV